MRFAADAPHGTMDGYNFEGLRKFHPVREACYLAHPGGLALPVVLADIAALSAGGYLKMMR